MYENEKSKIEKNSQRYYCNKKLIVTLPRSSLLKFYKLFIRPHLG